MSYVGVPPFGQTVRTITEKIAQQDQTIFYPDGGYIPGYVDIELDGADLGSQDFTATDGLSVVLAQKAGAGSLFRSKAFWPVAMQDTMRRAEINAIVGAGNWAMRNRIINGDMRIDQRNAGATVTVTAASSTATNGYFLDRFYMRSESAAGSKVSVGRSTTAPAGFSNSQLVTSLTNYTLGASDHFGVLQAIEGYNIADLAWGTASAAPITLSFRVRSSITGTFGGFIANNDADRAYVFSYTINSANTWETKTVTIAGDTSGSWLTNNNVGIYVGFSVGAGSSVSTAAGSWGSTLYRSVTGQTSLVGTSGATFYITGVQLEKGSYATPFDQRPYGAELALCQRYYWRDTAISIQAIAQASSYDGFAQVFFPVPMRATPTCTSLTGGSTFVRNISGGPASGIGTGTVNGAWPTHVEYLTQANGGTGGAGMGIIGYAGGTGTATAEL